MMRKSDQVCVRALLAVLPILAVPVSPEFKPALGMLFGAAGLSLVTRLFFDVTRPLFFAPTFSAFQVLWIAAWAQAVFYMTGIPPVWAVSVYLLVFDPLRFLETGTARAEHLSYGETLAAGFKTMVSRNLLFLALGIFLIFARYGLTRGGGMPVFNQAAGIFLLLAGFIFLRQNGPREKEKHD